MHIDDFDYHLPEELIAQYPADQRDHSRLLIVDRGKDTVEDKQFFQLLDYLRPGDCLVMNNSKVIPARIFGTKESTGAKIEFLLLKKKAEGIWETMVRPGKRLRVGDRVVFGEGLLKAEVLSDGADGTRIVQLEHEGDLMEILDQIGHIPLPPYIDRESGEADKERYQTVYCKGEGSVAAPTAGLHFTPELLQAVQDKGVELAYVTLHVGIGTFRPVSCEQIEDHQMHYEEYQIDQENAARINKTKQAGGRIISVGTTSTRTLESAAEEDGTIIPGRGNTNIFIYPGYQFKVIDGLVTNFHLPKSTLLMLISALYNRETMLKIYEDAVEKKYRFFSYGDAMFIL